MTAQGPAGELRWGAGSGVESWGGLWPLVFSCWMDCVALYESGSGPASSGAMRSLVFGLILLFSFTDGQVRLGAPPGLTPVLCSPGQHPQPTCPAWPHALVSGPAPAALVLSFSRFPRRACLQTRWLRKPATLKRPCYLGETNSSRGELWP